MSDLGNIKKQLTNLELLERELTLKQLQINRLLNITQAINDNLSADGLYNMYKSFLSWEMGLKKMALFVKCEDGGWECATYVGVEDKMINDPTISDRLRSIRRLYNVHEEEHPFINAFDIVIPVRHKDESIAYTFIGGFDENEDMYNKVQFITTITNIIAVAIENKRLFKRQLEQERLKKEMELAKEMQVLLVPEVLPKKNAYELSSIYQPHMGVGGDYFDYIDYGDERFAICIGDISGKGMAAALLMANFQANFRFLINQRIEPQALIERLNKSVLQAAKGEKFITFFFAEYNTRTRELIYVNAGHNPPILGDAKGYHLLKDGCTILGAFDELPEIECGKLTIEGESIIALYTDGVTDVQNSKEEYFDDMLLADFCSKNYKLSADDFNENLVNKVNAFMGAGQYPDDFSVLTCKIF